MMDSIPEIPPDPTPEQRMIELHDAYLNLEQMIIKLDNKINKLWRIVEELKESKE